MPPLATTGSPCHSCDAGVVGSNSCRHLMSDTILVRDETQRCVAPLVFINPYSFSGAGKAVVVFGVVHFPIMHPDFAQCVAMDKDPPMPPDLMRASPHRSDELLRQSYLVHRHRDVEADCRVLQELAVRAAGDIPLVRTDSTQNRGDVVH